MKKIVTLMVCMLQIIQVFGQQVDTSKKVIFWPKKPEKIVQPGGMLVIQKSGKPIINVFLFAEAEMIRWRKSNLNVYGYLQAGAFNQGYFGISYGRAIWSVGVAGGIDQNKNCRFGSKILINYKGFQALLLNELGKSGAWHRWHASYAVKKWFRIGIISHGGLGQGILTRFTVGPLSIEPSYHFINFVDGPKPVVWGHNVTIRAFLFF